MNDKNVRNDLLLESPINVTFDEILHMNDSEFRAWVIDMRKTVVDIWDNHGMPPRVGFTEDQMIDQFKEMAGFPVAEFLVEDEITGSRDVIRNTSIVGNAVNDFFPTMMKTRINYSKDPNAGKSIYDWFADDSLLERFMKYATRHFRRDSFYAYSNPVRVLDADCFGDLPVTASGSDWLDDFERDYRHSRYDYWLNPIDVDTTYTGYNEELKNSKYLVVTKDEIESRLETIPEHCRTNVDYSKSEYYHIRVFRRNQPLFPVGLKAFRVSFCQTAVNFPPLTAKFIWERYTADFKHEKEIVVWDPSSGWGGRLLGALSVHHDRKIRYLGNDPNTDHTISTYADGEIFTKYHLIHKFYTEHVRRGGIFNKPHNELEFWQRGSEDMEGAAFRKYKGKVSVVFTSPPYFSKEKYSEDPAQSCIKFSEYNSWRDEFLFKTLETAYNWLRTGGYIVWNIADAQFDGDMLPLEADSCKKMEDMGMKHVETLKMALAQSPGGNRLDPETGLPRAKNFAKVNGIWLKYEPVFVYKKLV